jgi:hypothetical protein
MRPSSLLLVAVAAMIAAPSRAAQDPLQPMLAETLRGGLASAATCVNHADIAEGGPHGGVLHVLGVPADATILHAWLYWTVLSIVSPVPTGRPAMDGVDLDVVSLGELNETPCFPDQDFTGAFRADVTSLVSGDGDHVLTGFLGDGTWLGESLTEGATLLVVWTATTAPDVTIVLFDGLDVASGDMSPTQQVLSGFSAPAVGPVPAMLVAAVGNGQYFGPDDFTFNDEQLGMIEPSVLSGSLCPGNDRGLYDHTRIDVTGLIPPGATSARLRMVATGDCYSLAAAALVIPAACFSSEPSALDLRPGATPLRVARQPAAMLRISWEAVRVSQLWRGTIGRWYDHAPVACNIVDSTADVPSELGNWYYLAAGCGPGAIGGRDSFGVARPTAGEASGLACP